MTSLKLLETTDVLEQYEKKLQEKQTLGIGFQLKDVIFVKNIGILPKVHSSEIAKRRTTNGLSWKNVPGHIRRLKMPILPEESREVPTFFFHIL